MILRVIVVTLGLGLLSGCATLSEDTCRAGDWQTIGFADGKDGRDSDHIYAHARACNDFGIAPIRATWEAGRQEGLKLYCRPERAWREGSHGNRLRNVCAPEDMRALRHENERGLQYYRIGRDIDEAERRISKINTLLREMSDTDPGRVTLTAERSILRLEVLRLRSRQHRYYF